MVASSNKNILFVALDLASSSLDLVFYGFRFGIVLKVLDSTKKARGGVLILALVDII